MEAFSKEITKHDKYLRNYAVSRYGDIGNDFLNDVYLRLHAYDKDKLKQMVCKGVIKFVMIRILGQIHIDYVRKKKEYATELIEPQQEKNIDLELYWNVLNEINKTAIEEAILVKLYEGSSIKEIAEYFEVNYFYIYNQIKQLKQKCEERATLLLKSQV